MAISQRQLFLNHLAQTTDFPMGLEIVKAEGVHMTDSNGKDYLDLISGISVSNIGHRNPQVVQAIKDQVDQYMHLMVYGEYIQSPQVVLAKKLAEQLGEGLDNVYFVGSGSEATEGAMKLAKRSSGRQEIISFNNAYHGSTQGALSIIGDEDFRRGYRPLLPGIRRINFNSKEELEQITNSTAAVIVEPVQGEAGYISPKDNYLQALRKRCNEVGALLIFDEIQTGFGRTGKLFAFQKFGVKPDIITLAKGMGGGMPIGAFIASKELMNAFKNNPLLGHITTFGGHPVSCAAAIASLDFLLEGDLIKQVDAKSKRFAKNLQHPKALEIRAEGFLLAIQLKSFDEVQKVLEYCLENGVISDWFLFNDSSIRISPPLIITNEQIDFACEVLRKGMDLL